MKLTIPRAIALAIVIALPASAQTAEKTSLKLTPKVQAGGTYRLEQLVKSTMSGGKQDHTVIQDQVLTATAFGQDGKDKLVTSRVERVRIETNATPDQNRISYDSADRSKQHPAFAETAKGLMTISSASIYGEDNIFKNFQGQVTDEATRQMMQKFTDLGFPKKPVSPGDSWKHQLTNDMGPMGQVRYDLDYKFSKMARYDGVNCVVLTITGELATIPGAAANEGFDIKSRSLRGVMYFDPKLGAVRKYEINSQLDITAYGKKMPGSMTLRTVLKSFKKH